MIVGPRITYASFRQPPDEKLHEGGYTQAIEFVGYELWLTFAGEGDMQSMKLYTTVERYRTDAGHLYDWGGGYVRMVLRDQPYDLQNESGNPVVRRYLGRGNGECIRVLGGATTQQRAILIHDTPHVGYVIGCIGRPARRPHALSERRQQPFRPGRAGDQGRARRAQGRGHALRAQESLSPRSRCGFVLDFTKSPAAVPQ